MLYEVGVAGNEVIWADSRNMSCIIEAVGQPWLNSIEVCGQLEVGGHNQTNEIKRNQKFDRAVKQIARNSPCFFVTSQNER